MARSKTSKATTAFVVVLGIAAAAYLGYDVLGIGKSADRFTSMPDVCEVAIGARMERWVPYAEQRGRWRDDSKVRFCVWSSGPDASAEQHANLALRATRYTRYGSVSGTEKAQDSFAGDGGRNPDNVTWTDEDGVGDEAVKHVNTATGQVRLNFRTGNLIVQIAYNRESADDASPTADDIAAAILAELN
jgi:hypothetical protein